MSDKKTGGPAFPCPQDGINQDVPSLGMTLRDYFAAASLPFCAELLKTIRADGDSDCVDEKDAVRIAAELSYEMADAMLAAREAA